MIKRAIGQLAHDIWDITSDSNIPDTQTYTMSWVPTFFFIFNEFMPDMNKHYTRYSHDYTFKKREDLL